MSRKNLDLRFSLFRLKTTNFFNERQLHRTRPIRARFQLVSCRALGRASSEAGLEPLPSFFAAAPEWSSMKRTDSRIRQTMVGLVALWLCCGVATANVIVTNLPGIFGDPIFGDGFMTGRYEVDIDGNGVWDVALEASSTQISAVANKHTLLQVYPSTPPNVGSWASPLLLGDVVGSYALYNAVWHRNNLGTSGMRVCVTSGCAGYWPEGAEEILDPDTGYIRLRPHSGYLAVAFTNSTGRHYGYVDVGVYDIGSAGLIYGWAWETEPDTPITIVPEPGSAGLVVLFAGLIWLRQSE